MHIASLTWVGAPGAPPPPTAAEPPLSRRRRCGTAACRQAAAGSFAPVAPPAHPTYDVYAAIDAALKEDAGDFGDISTNST